MAIGRGFYLSVLAAKAQLPSILVALNPEGQGGAVKGMGAPMASGAKKEDLAAPISRGVYVLSTPDKKTLLKMMVMPREEAGFDPAAFARSPMAQSWDPELRHRVESTWMLMQVTFESYDPKVYPSLDFVLAVTKRLAELTDGVVADPVAQVYKLPSQVVSPRPEDEQVSAQDHVQVKVREHEGALHVFTLGLSKFDHPEVEVYGIEKDHKETAKRFMMALAQTVLRGTALPIGAAVGKPGSGFKVAGGGLDRGLWEGIPCLELVPEGKGTADEAVRAWLETVP
ncbi:MAG TPA: hypothetical protein VNI20_05955 [Fimbriimonadaceae bacterium]|nr:hypothetical protein [Fimbriimonadaceae bacterium]